VLVQRQRHPVRSRSIAERSAPPGVRRWLGEVPGLTPLSTWDGSNCATDSSTASTAGRGLSRLRRHDSQTSIGCVFMGEIVVRVRLTGGDHMDVTYEESDTVDADEIIEHLISTLAQDTGVLRTRHGDRLVVLYGRGVAAVEMAPRGPVL
jgi:hypothetical protein